MLFNNTSAQFHDLVSRQYSNESQVNVNEQERQQAIMMEEYIEKEIEIEKCFKSDIFGALLLK